MAALKGDASGKDSVAVTGTATGKNSAGVLGQSDAWSARGVGGAVGVHAEGNIWHGLEGISHSTTGGFGVYGTNITKCTGPAGISTRWIGVYCETPGLENGPAAVWGEHKGRGNGVGDISNGGEALVALSAGTAGVFHGDVHITGSLEVSGDSRLTTPDCAEHFDMGALKSVGPGTVMALFSIQDAHDKRVSAVASGAGGCKPGLVLDQRDAGRYRQPIELLGKAFCKFDTQYGPTEIADLPTTSPTPGYAMKAADPRRPSTRASAKHCDRPIRARA